MRTTRTLVCLLLAMLMVVLPLSVSAEADLVPLTLKLGRVFANPGVFCESVSSNVKKKWVCHPPQNS